VKRVIEEPSADVSNIVYHTLTIDKFFDPLDATYLQHLLDQKTEAVGYQSDFACPVIVRIYFPAGKAPDRETLILRPLNRRTCVSLSMRPSSMSSFLTG
jgi:hypothetical protein